MSFRWSIKSEHSPRISAKLHLIIFRAPNSRLKPETKQHTAPNRIQIYYNELYFRALRPLPSLGGNFSVASHGAIASWDKMLNSSIYAAIHLQRSHHSAWCLLLSPVPFMSFRFLFVYLGLRSLIICVYRQKQKQHQRSESKRKEER